MMTPDEHAKKSTQMKRAITLAKKKATACGTLAEKLDAQRHVKDLQARLQQHRLNYHQLTEPAFAPAEQGQVAAA